MRHLVATSIRLVFLRLLAAAAFVVVGWPQCYALAQEPAPAEDADLSEEIPRGETVRSRPKPELDPNGITVGSFLFYPEFKLTGTYDDNIMSSENDTVSDYITTFGVVGDIQSNWDTHFVSFVGEVEAGRYRRLSKEDYVDVNTSAEGRYDIGEGDFVKGKVDAKFGHEARSSLDDAGGKEPTQTRNFIFDGKTKHHFGKTSFGTNVNVERYDYDDVESTTGTVNNDDRDRFESEASVRGGYEFNPESEWFLKGEYYDRRYDEALDDSGYNRDSQGYEVTTGLSFDLTGITFGNVFAGYRRQSYDDRALKTAQGIAGGLDITWNASPITTVIGTVERTVEETTSTGASGIFRNKMSLSVDHELLRNMILGAEVVQTHNAFVGIDRNDEEFDFTFSVDYKMFRNLYVGMSYDYSMRNSDTGNSDYSKNVIKLELSVQF